MRHLYALTVFTVGLLMLAGPIAAQDWTGRSRARGVVVSAADGSPIAHAKVTLTWDPNPNSGPPPLTTNKKGEYKILGLRSGSWLALVEAEGYIPKEERFTVYEGAQVDTVRIEVREVPAEVKEAERRVRMNEMIEAGNAFLEADKTAAARAKFEEVLGEADEDMKPSILLGIASTYLKEKNDQLAIDHLQRALSIDENHEPALRLLVSILVAQGKDEEAKEYLARVSEADLDPAAQLNLGIMRYNEGDLEGAAEIFQRVREGNPEIAEANYFCGLIEMNQEKNADALTSLQKFLEMAPDHVKAAEAAEFVSYLQKMVEE